MTDPIPCCDGSAAKPKFSVAEPHNLSPRAKWLRDYYFKGVKREWNNEYSPFTTGVTEDRIWFEGDYYIVPEMYTFMGVDTKGPYNTAFEVVAKKVPLPPHFWDLPLPVRRASFVQEVLCNQIPQEIVSDHDLLAGGRFNTQLSKCFNPQELKAFEKMNRRNRYAAFKYHNDGFGNAGATGGHLIPDYKTIVEKGFQALYNKTQQNLGKLSAAEIKGPKGQELQAMAISCETPKKLAQKYVEECRRLIAEGKTPTRTKELNTMIANLEQVPWGPAKTFWQGLQALWMTHMLVMSEESYPGPGVSFGRIDQILWPLYEKDVIKEKKITREFAKDLFSVFIFHCNTAYDAQIRIGKQGITAGFGQLITLSGLGPKGEDLTNDLTYMILECFDEWYPILEPKPNVRLHRNSPDHLLDVLIDMITRAQGAPFILNFDERSYAGLITQGVPKEDVWDYGCVGCLENTMQGNDRSGTVNCNPNLAKSMELVLWNGHTMPGNIGAKKPALKYIGTKPGGVIGPQTGEPETFTTWDQFYTAWKAQICAMMKYMVKINNFTEELRAQYLPTPYLSVLVDGMIEKGMDIRQAPPKYGFITVEGVGFATTVDSLLAVKKYIYDEKRYTIKQLKDAIIANYAGTKEFEIMKALFTNKAPKYGNDQEDADKLAKEVMQFWVEELKQYKTPTGFQYRGGMLSWNYWAGEDAALTVATPNGRVFGTFMSNAICPTNGADVSGPTSVTNSVGHAIGGKAPDGSYINLLPNGASHTITFNPSLLRDTEHKEKFKAYLRSYVENGGTALQINILDPEMLKDAQQHPQNYGNLLVRVTGYNAFFTSIGRELQDEIIARESHKL